MKTFYQASFPDIHPRGRLDMRGRMSLRRVFRLRGRGEEGERMVLGIPDAWIWGAYLLCILCTAICVIYGLMNWNKEGDEASQTEVRTRWEMTEEKAEANL